MSEYTLILRACPESHRESAATFIGKLFSLKEHTTQQIVASCPIVLLTGLGREEAAAMHLLAHSLGVLGAQFELTPMPPGDLPKIDWPRRPQVFKRELTEWVGDLQVPLPGPAGQPVRLIDLLLAALEGKAPVKAEFKGSQLPEVTPFGTPALPSEPRVGRTPQSIAPPRTPTPAPIPPPPSAGGDTDDPMARLNELFPEDDGGSFAKAGGGSQDISNLLNKILPDEAPGGIVASTPSGANVRLSEGGSGGFSVFLAKIADEDRRKKAATLIAELAKVTPEEAETLSKKMIIPVLKGATKEEAEAAKAQFGKIGILARVKGPE